MIALVGETVTESGLGDLHAGHGQFRLENPGPEPVDVTLDELWLEVGDRKDTIEAVSVFQTDTDTQLDPAGFSARSGATNFLVGFRSVADPTGPGERLSVGLRLMAGETALEARSPVVFERRIARF